MSILIRMLSGGTAGREFLFDQQVVVFGRDSDSDFVIPGNDVSRRHCRLVVVGESSGCRLEDLGSSNGTFVNDSLIQSKDLVVGDCIRISGTRFELLAVGDASDDSSPGQEHRDSDLGTAKQLERSPIQTIVAASSKSVVEQLVSAVSHRINNYLQLSSGGEFLVDAGLEAKDLEQVAQGWRTVRRTQNRIHQLSVNLTTYCHDFNPLFRNLNLHQLIKTVVDELGNSFDTTRLKVVHQTAADLTLELDEHYCSRAIENILCVGLMASEARSGSKSEVVLETSLVDEEVLIRVCFRHFDDRYNLAELIKSDGEVSKIKGELGLLELLVSRRIVEGQGGTIKGGCEAQNLNWIEVRFPVG